MDKGPLIRGLCQECFRLRYKLLHVPSELQLTLCRKCNAYSMNGRWFPAVGGSALESAIQAVVLSNVRVVKLTPSGMQFLAMEKAKGLESSMKIEISRREAIVDILARGRVHELQVEPKEEHVRVAVKLKLTTCDVCRLKGVGHHEAILQVRGKGKLSAEVL
ncbi:MAG: 60S ribosomal export protein NMD3, partial [Hadesarchaea archaeon]|nr:60S ribosomal export protein NMD3 [Hadesarchaea archaeon]